MHPRTKHGHCTGGVPPEYNVWSTMKARCSNPNHKDFHNYGGRGISVCHRWRKFENFISDMGFRPSVKHTLERRDNNKDYCPSNCRWATQKEQQNHRRNNHLITRAGRTQTLQQWADELGMNRQMIYKRIVLRGWSVDKALTTPPMK